LPLMPELKLMSKLQENKHKLKRVVIIIFVSVVMINRFLIDESFNFY